MKYLFLITLCIITGNSLSQEFTQLKPEITGINFSDINSTGNWFGELGGGVGVGDINNDGLEDLFFSSNFQEDRLYLNLGELKFKDVTEQYFEESLNDCHTGVTMIDINNDGWLDIYVSCANNDSGKSKNKLFINDNGQRFKNQAALFGLDDSSKTSQAAFFDFDLDGDLDAYLMNYCRPNETDLNQFDGSKLMINEGGRFVDKSKDLRFPIGSATLGSFVGDLNNDFALDIFQGNMGDAPPNYLVNYDGKVVREFIHARFAHYSKYVIGVDAADINGNGYMDLLTTSSQFLIENQINMGPGEQNEVKRKVYGIAYETLAMQLNLKGFFSDIADMSGLSNFSNYWAGLFFDFDNNQTKDLFLMNGPKFAHEKKKKNHLQDLSSIENEGGSKKNTDQFSLNRLLKNNGDLTFSNAGLGSIFEDDGIGISSASYADLDKDGDLDIICATLGGSAFILKNESDKSNFLDVSLKGDGSNLEAIGAKIYVYTDSLSQYGEVQFTRGFRSSVSRKVHFGIGQFDSVDSIVVRWNILEKTVLKNVKVNQEILIEKKNVKQEKRIFERKTGFELSKLYGLKRFHKEKEAGVKNIDPFSGAHLGPILTKGDINSDGRSDLFIPGPKGQESVIYAQTEFGEFVEYITLERSLNSEDLDAVIFDADNDGDNDIFVVSGGNEDAKENEVYQDRLYRNDGNGNLIYDSLAVPVNNESNLKVLSTDLNADGWVDLLVFGRQVPGSYPSFPNSAVLINHSGKFVNETMEYVPGFIELGMVTDAELIDFDFDNDLDLIVVGELMPITIFENIEGKYKNITKDQQLSETFGFWNSVDIITEEKESIRLVLGNVGANAQNRLRSYFSTDALIQNKELIYSNSLLEISSRNMKLTPLKNSLQLGSINKVISFDFDGDQFEDLLMLGNNYNTNEDIIRLDGNLGVVCMKGLESNMVDYLGISLNIKDAEILNVNNDIYVVLGVNDGRILTLKYYK